ncbi:MAG TPA: LTA synthase family protein [Candidatus Binatia bacterium]|nr:LTA synthase family protein [Candidatus Binatia bacterium]
MNEAAPLHVHAWRRSRYGFAGFWLLSLMLAWLALRLVLFVAFRPATPLAEVLLTFLVGLYRDLLVACWLVLPLLFCLLITPESWFRAGWYRRLFWSACLVFWLAEIFLLFVEYFFFEEFKSRFNTVAVDYLLYPQEVVGNIWVSYPVGRVLGICLVLALAWVLAARHLFAGTWTQPFPARSRLLRLGAAAALVGAVAPLLLMAGALTGVLNPRLHLTGSHLSSNRTLNELADNGAISFLAAALTHHLEYGAFYKTLPREQAYQRVRRLLTESNTRFSDDGASTRRQVAGDTSRPRLNVVILLEESLGSEFWGCLGRTNTLTPEMDKLAADEGLLFTNIYACGNRTVRGMEGVLASFPPLPGDSIVKRDLSDNVETIARVLKRDGYSTLFLYGGRGLFDGMRSFAIRNGYDRFVEQKHFEHPTFTTIWGVCDEDLFARAIDEFRDLAKTGQPFFGTVLSVSNHKPYTYPKGKILEDPDERRRENAVKYSDFALGQFFRAAKKEAFWTNTLFAVVADHGARVYGSQSIPIHSYEIPVLLAGPAVVKGPARIPQLGGSLDVAPTLLGLVGRPYETMFFGHDLFNCRPENGRAFLNHNRDIGLFARDQLVVLGLMQTAEFYTGDPKVVDMKPLLAPTDSARELEQDAIALYQVADDLYVHQRYRIDSMPALSLPSAQPAATSH